MWETGYRVGYNSCPAFQLVKRRISTRHVRRLPPKRHRPRDVTVPYTFSLGGSFEADVAPVLSLKCVRCHHPENLKGGLDLTTRAQAIRGGDQGTSLVPGKPFQSPLYVRCISKPNEKPEMPESGEPLTETEANALRDWITDGAQWPESIVLKNGARGDGEFWAFLEIRGGEGNDRRDAYPTGIDGFVDAKLRELGLERNEPAEPRTLIRRMTYDLTGLPPTPEEVERFVHAAERDREAAIEALIDRLLESPHYGEHWGRHWLDVIRFGESRGYERNEIITNLWPFRDYIIRSFNADKPFDQLIVEHLAGDVIGKDQPEIEIGSAFLVAGPYDDVGNQDAMAAAQIRADQMDEMIRATSEAFMGLTLGCARCHDHKFDPITTQDYYALFATFAGTKHGPREVATAAEREQRKSRLEPLQSSRKDAVAEKEKLEAEINDRAKQAEAELATTWQRPRVSRYGTEERFPPVTAQHVRMRVFGTDTKDPNQRQFKLDEFEVWTDESNPRNVACARNGGTATGTSKAAQDFAGAYSVELVIDEKFGERWHPNVSELVVHFAKPESINRIFFSSDRLKGLGEDHSLTTFVGDYRIEVSLDEKTWTEVAHSFDRVPPSDPRKLSRLREAVITPHDTEILAKLNKEIQRLDRAIAQIPTLPVWWVGNHESAPGPFAIYQGGNPQRRGEEIWPASLSVLKRLPSAYQLDATHDEGARRLALARWLTAPDHPLTSRVIANRVWHYHFGRGIVATPSDFGFMGARPTHPELLDWLARYLQDHQWHLKSLHRLIMSSKTYQQSSHWREAAAKLDGDSQWLWRFPPRRFQAEEIRDTMLAVSGQLNTQMGGPGFKLYEYQQDNVATYVPLDHPGRETYRRSVYHHNARAARVDVLTDFDCPDPAFAEPRRAATITPVQALTMMNHPFVIDMATAFAKRLENDTSDPHTRIERAFLLAYGRKPTDTEVKQGMQIAADVGLRALTRAIFNSSELITLD